MVLEIVPAAPTTNGEAAVPTLDEKSEAVETSNPAGGVTVTPSVMKIPESEKLVAEEGTP